MVFYIGYRDFLCGMGHHDFLKHASGSLRLPGANGQKRKQGLAGLSLLMGSSLSSFSKDSIQNRLQAFLSLLELRIPTPPPALPFQVVRAVCHGHAQSASLRQRCPGLGVRVRRVARCGSRVLYRIRDGYSDSTIGTQLARFLHQLNNKGARLPAPPA